MLAAGFGAISLDGLKVGSIPTNYCRGSRNWARRFTGVGEATKGRMIRPRTVGTYPQLTPHYLTYCRDLCTLST